MVHGLPPDEESGTPLVADGYARTLAARGWLVRVLYMAPDAPPWGELGVERRGDEPFERVPLRPVTRAGSVWTLDAPAHPAYDPAVAATAAADPNAALERLFRRLAPSVLHVVDNVHLPLSIPEVAHGLGVPVVRTVSCTEDLCALVAPVSPRSGPHGYCPAPLSVDRCADCVAATGSPAFEAFLPSSDAVADRRRRADLLALLETKRSRALRQFTDVFDRIVFASDAFRAYFESSLPLDANRVRVLPMGVDLAEVAPQLPERTRGPADPLCFVLAANADAAKGIDAVVGAFSHPEVASRDDWRLMLAGGGDRGLFGALLDDPRVEDLGPYRPDELPAVLARADVGLATSVFETFHRVTREYLRASLPVVGSTAFGITDVVVDGSNGLLFDHADPGSLRRAVVALIEDRDLVGRLRRGAAATRIRTVVDEVDLLESLYDEVLRAPSRPEGTAVPSA